ncbi:hypothetical protein BJ508DRAFT_315679 [Ascobolus immersus RN42]|uniref:Uncharacterized protein n=1 Tax=Ascobolus immersus RN42 TaxID=1160509 RepID=A0A3N4HDQ2_ASCIM|nr:hypothetical protein BJ508DRAFT_315679 [Ascobolus immersus RN42]
MPVHPAQSPSLANEHTTDLGNLNEPQLVAVFHDTDNIEETEIWFRYCCRAIGLGLCQWPKLTDGSYTTKDPWISPEDVKTYQRSSATGQVPLRSYNLIGFVAFISRAWCQWLKLERYQGRANRSPVIGTAKETRFFSPFQPISPILVLYMMGSLTML